MSKALSSVNYTNTVPDTVLDKARKSKLGEIAKGPSVKHVDEKLKPINYGEAERDFKYLKKRINFFLFTLKRFFLIIKSFKKNKMKLSIDYMLKAVHLCTEILLL